MTWSLFGFYSRRVVVVHGVGVNIFLNTMCYIILTVSLLFFGRGQFVLTTAEITGLSARNEVLGAVLGVTGLLFFNVALNHAPNENITAAIILITGFFPVAAMVLGTVFFGVRLTPHQWLGVALAALALYLVNKR
ncbi:hypothetical protein EPN83_02360 [Patescibacteria group bacterium]|nr:MAG: hypothetical protein EPN83_02360 [Patescibacteria group bacterium]